MLLCTDLLTEWLPLYTSFGEDVVRNMSWARIVGPFVVAWR